jgi:AcrR family transcriptional regulator
MLTYPPMARPTVIRTETILEAARAVFLEKGITATSSEVAVRAGVSEGSLFKRFKTKGELFRAAMGVDVNSLPSSLIALEGRVGKGTVEDNLVEAGLIAIEGFQRIFPFMMMSWSNPKVPGCLPDGLDTADPPPLRAQRFVAAYLEAEIELGRIRPIEPKTLARAYMGALSAYVFSEMLVSRSGGHSLDSQSYVRDLVGALWSGMRPAHRASSVPAVEAAPRARGVAHHS